MTAERATWRKIGWIQAHRSIELALHSVTQGSSECSVHAVRPEEATSKTTTPTPGSFDTVNAERKAALDELSKVVDVAQDLTNQVRLLKRRSHVYHAVILGFIVLINLLLWKHSSVLIDLNTDESLNAMLELSSTLIWYFGQSLTIIYVIIVLCS